MKLPVIAIILALPLVASPAVGAQSQMSSGNIALEVRDSSGALVPGARVSATNIETGATRTDTTSPTGATRFVLLPPGSYELKVEMTGFGVYTRRPVSVTIGQTSTVVAELSPASVQEEVFVQEDAPVLEPEKTQQSDTITTERIANLPINARNFLDFSLLTPGVTDSKALVNFSLPQTPTSGLSFAGQGGRSNSVTIDGVDNNDNAVASVRATLSQEAVQEFQINRSNFSAEFGRASGGLINIVSRSGGNTYHGSAFAFLRDQALDARNPFAFGANGAPIEPPFSRLQAGFASGGAIRKDKTFYFLSYEGLRQRESNFVSFLENERIFQPTASQNQLLSFLNTAPTISLRTIGGALGGALTTTERAFPDTIRLLRQNSGVFPFRNNTNTASLRLDHAPTASNQMFGRITFSDTDTIGGAFGGLRGPSRGANYQIQDLSVVFGDTHFFSPKRVNEFRFQFATRDFNSFSADPAGPEININGVAFLGRDFFLPSLRQENRFQFVDNFTVIAGDHEIKFGGDYNYLPFDTSTEVFFGGRFIFGEQVPLGLIIDNLTGQGNAAGLGATLASLGRADLIPNLSAPISSLQAFNLGLPLAYQQGFGNPRAELTNKVLAMYVQDNYRVTGNLTLNLGLRYDYEAQPAPIHRDSNNIAPRVGFSFSPAARTVVRGGYGVYYAPIFQAVGFVGKVLDGTQISQIFVPLTGLPQLGITATSAQVWGLARQQNLIGNRTIAASDIARFGLRPGTTPPVILRSSPTLVNPYSQQGSLGIDRELSQNLSASINYIFNKGSKVLRSRNVNLRQIGTNAFGPVYGAINPRILQDSVVESSGASIYHGMALSVARRFSNHYQFQVAYTFAKAIDDTTDFITDLQAADQLNLRGERSLSSFDQRQRLVISGVFESPFDPGSGAGRVLGNITVSPIVTLSSGHPFNLLLGSDVNSDTNANTDRPALAGRNTGEGPGLASFDLRVSKTFNVSEKYRLEGMFEAFNLFNRVNFSGVNSIIGLTPLSSYRVQGRRDVGPTGPLGFTSAFDPRQIQLGVRLRF